MKKVLSVLSLFFCLTALASTANALTWTISPDANTTAFGVTVVDGVAQIGSPDSGTQPPGIYGAGFTATGTSFGMFFDADLYSWDSYNQLTTIGTGYYDAFIVTISTQNFYWNLPNLSDPITANASTFVWGGKNWNDGKQDHYITAPGSTDFVSLTSSTPTTFYVSLVLDTKTTPQTDYLHPSYGSFHVSPVPEPGTVLLLGSGLLGLGLYGRRRARA